MSKSSQPALERGAAVRVSSPDTERRRVGRPAAEVFTAAEVAEKCACTVEKVLRVLADEKWRPLFFAGARLGTSGEWSIPARDVRLLVGGPVRRDDPPPLRTVREFAALMGWPLPTTYERIRAGIVKTRLVLDEMKVPVTEYWNVPEHRPAVDDAPGDPRAAARLSFFARKRASKASEVAR